MRSDGSCRSRNCPVDIVFCISGYFRRVGAGCDGTGGCVRTAGMSRWHDAVSMAIIFDEEPKNIKRHPLVGTLIRGSTDPSTGKQTNQAYSNEEHGPLITLREKDSNNKRRYTFTVTPRAPVGLRIRLSGGYKDSSGNQGTTISSTAIRSSVPVSNAGLDQTVGSGTTVVLNGNGSACAPGTIDSTGYAWTRTGGTEGVTATLHNANTKTATFTADPWHPVRLT